MNPIASVVAIRVAVAPASLILALACAHQTDDCTQMFDCGGDALCPAAAGAIQS